MQQATFDLAFPTSYHTHDFVITDSNASAHGMISQWPEGATSNGILLTGPQASGKTHLAHIWAEMQDALFVKATELGGKSSAEWFTATQKVVLEDIEHCESDALFHLLQHLNQNKECQALLTSVTPLNALWKEPRDIHSRLCLLNQAQLDAPDDNLLQALLIKGFSDRQLKVDAAVIAYLLPRIERSCVAVYQLLNALDDAALQEKRAITLPLARRVLDKISE